MDKNQLGASLYPDRTIAPASKELNFGSKRAHKMRGVSRSQKSRQSAQRRIHSVEQFLQLDYKAQLSELRKIQPLAKIETRQSGKKKWSGELWIGNECRLRTSGATSGKAFRKIMVQLAPELVKAREELDAQSAPPAQKPSNTWGEERYRSGSHLR